MFNNIDLFNPDKIIQCASLKEAKDIYEIMKKMDAKSYVYAISYLTGGILNPVIKIGMSSPDKYRQHTILGERIVRQISNLEGWSSKPVSSHGLDLVVGLKKAIETGILPEKAINRNNIIICIWNVHPNFRKCNSIATEDEQTKWLEGKLCSLHKKHFQKLPPLNVIDPSVSVFFRKGRIPTNEDLDNTLFEWQQ